MRSLLGSTLALSLILSPVAALADDDDPPTGGEKSPNTFDGNGETASLICTDEAPTASVSGSNNTITITGPCTEVAVQGASNTVAVAAVKTLDVQGASNQVAAELVTKIVVQGSGNKVTWKKSPTKKKRPIVKKSGVDNRVSKIK